MRDGWQIKKLGDVCSLLNRGVSPAYLEKGGVCVLNQKCIRNHEISYEPARRHDDAVKKVAEERFIQLGDVLVNSTGTGTLGRVAQVRSMPEEATTVDSHVTIVRPKSGMFNLDFFGYMLIVIEEAIKEAGDGCGGQTELARSVLAERFTVSYPESLVDQQRIIALLNEAFEGLATAKTNAEQNLQNARALFECHLQSVFSSRGKGWEEKTLGDVCDATQGVQVPKSEQSPSKLPGYRRYLYISDFESDKNLKYVRDEHPKKLVTPDDIIVANTGSAGKIFRGIDGILSNNLFKVSFDASTVDRDFIFFFVTSGLFREYQLSIMRGTANPHMGHVNFKSTPICIPSIAVQKIVVEQIHEFAEETQRLTRLYERKLASLEELKKSLLRQAFNGEL